MIDLTELETKILMYLKTDAKAPLLKIAKDLDTTSSRVKRAIIKFEKNEIILGSSVIVNYKKIGMNISAIIAINIDYKFLRQYKYNVKDFMKYFKEKYSWFDSLSVLADMCDILLHIKVKDQDDLNIKLHQIRNIEGVKNVKEYFVDYEIKR